MSFGFVVMAVAANAIDGQLVASDANSMAGVALHFVVTILKGECGFSTVIEFSVFPTGGDMTFFTRRAKSAVVPL
jgi:hypothetical protein